MPLFRRREPLHERMAREGGLHLDPLPEPSPPRGAAGDPVYRPGEAGFAGFASSHGMETGIHGVPRARQWDAVVTVEVEGVAGERARFVALADETLVVEEGGDVEPLAIAVEQAATIPYRAEATRRSGSQWVVGIRELDVVELPDDPGGDELTLAVRDDEHTLTVDGVPVFGTIAELERYGAARGRSYVVQARRIDGAAWEVEAMPL